MKYDDRVLPALLQWQVVIVQNEEGEQFMDFFSSQTTGFFVRLIILHHVFSCSVA